MTDHGYKDFKIEVEFTYEEDGTLSDWAIGLPKETDLTRYQVLQALRYVTDQYDLLFVRKNGVGDA